MGITVSGGHLGAASAQECGAALPCSKGRQNPLWQLPPLRGHVRMLAVWRP